MKSWQSSTALHSFPSNSDFISALLSISVLLLTSITPSGSFIQEQTSPVMCMQQNPQHDYSPRPTTGHVLLRLCTILRNKHSSKKPPGSSSSQADNRGSLFAGFVSPSYNCEVNQSKQHVRNHSKTHHGKINKVVLFFAHMANFGNASTCVYLKQKIAQSVLQMRRFVTSFSRTGSQQAHLKLFNS